MQPDGTIDGTKDEDSTYGKTSIWTFTEKTTGHSSIPLSSFSIFHKVNMGWIVITDYSGGFFFINGFY